MKPRHFTIGLVNGQHLRILAGDEPTRQWALSVQARISIVTRAVTDELVGWTVVDDDLLVSGPKCMSVAQIRARFLELLVATFPRQRFVVEGETAPPASIVSDLPTEADVRHGMFAMLTGYAPVELTKR